MKKLKDILSEVLSEGLSSSDIKKATDAIQKYIKRLGKRANGEVSTVSDNIGQILRWDDNKIKQLTSYLYKLNKGSDQMVFETVETEDDTEFTVKLSHLLKKHVSKGGEIEEAIDTHIPQIADDKKYVAEFRKKYGAQETNKFLSFEIEPLAGSGHFNYRDIAKLAKKNKFGIWDTVRLVNKAYVNQVKGVPMNVKNESVDEAMDINDPILVSIRARQTMLKKMKSAPKVKKISIKQYLKLMDVESDIIDQMKDATKEYEQLDSDMNAEAGQKGADWSDADANRYGGDLNKLQTKIEKLARQKHKVKKAIMNYRVN